MMAVGTVLAVREDSLDCGCAVLAFEKEQIAGIGQFLELGVVDVLGFEEV